MLKAITAIAAVTVVSAVDVQDALASLNPVGGVQDIADDEFDFDRFDRPLLKLPLQLPLLWVETVPVPLFTEAELDDVAKVLEEFFKSLEEADDKPPTGTLAIEQKAEDDKAEEDVAEKPVPDLD